MYDCLNVVTLVKEMNHLKALTACLLGEHHRKLAPAFTVAKYLKDKAKIEEQRMAEKDSDRERTKSGDAKESMIQSDRTSLQAALKEVDSGATRPAKDRGSIQREMDRMYFEYLGLNQKDLSGSVSNFSSNSLDAEKDQNDELSLQNMAKETKFIMKKPFAKAVIKLDQRS